MKLDLSTALELHSKDDLPDFFEVSFDTNDLLCLEQVEYKKIQEAYTEFTNTLIRRGYTVVESTDNRGRTKSLLCYYQRTIEVAYDFTAFGETVTIYKKIVSPKVSNQPDPQIQEEADIKAAEAYLKANGSYLMTINIVKN